MRLPTYSSQHPGRPEKVSFWVPILMFKAHMQKILWSSEPTYGDVSRYGHKTQSPKRLEGARQGGLDRSWFDCSEAPVCRQPESEFGSGPGKKKKPFLEIELILCKCFLCGAVCSKLRQSVHISRKLCNGASQWRKDCERVGLKTMDNLDDLRL